MASLFSRNTIGLDISDQTIEVVQMSSRGLNYKVNSYGRILLDLGVLEKGRIKDKRVLKEAVKKVFKLAKPKPLNPKSVVFSLQDSQVYNFNFSLEGKDLSNMDKIVYRKVLENVPVEEGDLTYGYRVINKDKDSIEVVVVASSQEVMNEWLEFFNNIKVEIDFFDIEPLALYRGLMRNRPDVPVCLVDIGADTTNVSIFNQYGLKTSFIINQAGYDISREIADTLGVPIEKADDLKVHKGIVSSKSEIYDSATKVLNMIIKEVKDFIAYYEENEIIKQVVLVGGTSKMKGVEKYFAENMEIEVMIGENNKIKETLPLEYIQAMGLALRGLDSFWDKRDPVLPLPGAEKKKNKIKLDFNFKLGKKEDKENKKNKANKEENLGQKQFLSDKNEQVSDKKAQKVLKEDVEQYNKKKMILQIFILVDLILVFLLIFYFFVLNKLK